MTFLGEWESTRTKSARCCGHCVPGAALNRLAGNPRPGQWTDFLDRCQFLRLAVKAKKEQRIQVAFEHPPGSEFVFATLDATDGFTGAPRALEGRAIFLGDVTQAGWGNLCRVGFEHSGQSQ